MTTKTVAEFTTVHAVRMAGCGHITFLSAEHRAERLRDHKSFYCATCGRNNYYTGTSDLEELQGRLNTIQDQRDTARKNLNEQREKTRSKARQLSAQKGVTTRIKNRIANGVCPCCKRTFQNLARHMKGQHPDYKNVRKRNSKKQ